MKEFIAYIVLPVVAFAWFVVFLTRNDVKLEEKEKERWGVKKAMEDYEKERIRHIAELEIENEDMEKKKKAEEEKLKNPWRGLFRNMNNK
ncbi:hypothetical protein [Nostoc favosum]|uniref:Uncharacterized protein n=1 Tax=Nostoc favosum CHAB5714 TaxID=2780399 RepID=A0ABS8IFH8_9NOSO|nr:hypothetical protein [Nostoc favosum]MCC5602212.1 hypothetical protein [Nostoc favosum CHAB5714]